MVLLLRYYTYTLPRIQRGVHYFPGGGQTFSRGGGGPNGIFFRNHERTCYFPEGGVSGPPIPLLIRTWAMSS